MHNHGGLAPRCPCAEPGLAARIAHRQLLKSTGERLARLELSSEF